MKDDISEVVAQIRNGDKIGIMVFLHHGGDINARNSMGWTLLHLACFEGKTEIVEILLDHGAQVNCVTTDQKTPLHRAAAQGCKGAVAALLNKKPYVNAQDKTGNTPLHEAARGGYTSIVNALIKNKADKTKLNNKKQTFLDLVGQQVMPLVECGDLDSITLWLDWGLSPDTCGSLGWSMMHHAAARGQPDVVKLLLDRGANVNILDSNKSSPLHSAAFHGQKEVAKILLWSGANINAQDQRGNTPLHSAVSGSHADLINQLIDGGADTTIINNEGYVFHHLVKDVLVSAVHDGKTAQVLSLLKANADPNTRDCFGTPVLCVASFRKDLLIVDALLEAGADPDLTSLDSKKTALHYAAFWEDLFIMKSLLDHKASINPTDKFGGTPLHEAAREGHVDVITMLLGRRAAVSLADDDGNTPLHVAAKNGQTAAVELLMEHGASEAIRNKDNLLYSDLALIHAVRTEEPDKVISGLAWGGDPNSKDHKGWTLLHHAVYKGSLNITSLLIECNADVNITDNHGRTALILAAYRGNCSIAAKLVDSGANLDVQDWEGQTALHWGAREGSVDTVLYLIDHGADTSLRDNQGNRFSFWLVRHLYLAIRHNDSEKVDQLLAAGADQNAKVDGTDVTPKEEAKRRKCYFILKQLVAKAPQAKHFEEPDYWDMPTIEDLRLLFKGGSEDSSSEEDSDDEWKMTNADVVLSAKEVFAENLDDLWEVWDEKPKWVSAKELFQEDVQDFWDSWEEKPKIISAKEAFKEEDTPWWNKESESSENESSESESNESESSSSEDDTVTQGKTVQTDNSEFKRAYQEGDLISAKEFFKEDDDWWNDANEKFEKSKAVSAKEFFNDEKPWWEAENDSDEESSDGSSSEDEDESSSDKETFQKDKAVPAKEFFREDECWWRDAVEEIEEPKKVISAKEFFKSELPWWQTEDENEFSTNKAIPAKDVFKEETEWWENDEKDDQNSLADECDEAYESIISDTSTMYSASEGTSSDQFQDCDWLVTPDNSEASSAVIKAKDLFKEEAWWDDGSDNSDQTELQESDSNGLNAPLKEMDTGNGNSDLDETDDEDTQADSIVEEEIGKSELVDQNDVNTNVNSIEGNDFSSEESSHKILAAEDNDKNSDSDDIPCANLPIMTKSEIRNTEKTYCSKNNMSDNVIQNSENGTNDGPEANNVKEIKYNENLDANDEQNVKNDALINDIPVNESQQVDSTGTYKIIINKMDVCLAELDARIALVDSQLKKTSDMGSISSLNSLSDLDSKSDDTMNSQTFQSEKRNPVKGKLDVLKVHVRVADCNKKSSEKNETQSEATNVETVKPVIMNTEKNNQLFDKLVESLVSNDEATKTNKSESNSIKQNLNDKTAFTSSNTNSSSISGAELDNKNILLSQPTSLHAKSVTSISESKPEHILPNNLECSENNSDVSSAVQKRNFQISLESTDSEQNSKMGKHDVLGNEVINISNENYKNSKSFEFDENKRFSNAEINQTHGTKLCTSTSTGPVKNNDESTIQATGHEPIDISIRIKEDTNDLKPTAQSKEFTSDDKSVGEPFDDTRVYENPHLSSNYNQNTEYTKESESTVKSSQITGSTSDSPNNTDENASVTSDHVDVTPVSLSDEDDNKSLCVSREESIDRDSRNVSPTLIMNKGIWRCSTYDEITISQFDKIASQLGRSQSFTSKQASPVYKKIETSRESLSNEPATVKENLKGNSKKHIDVTDDDIKSPDDPASSKGVDGSSPADNDANIDSSVPNTNTIPSVTPRRNKDMRRSFPDKTFTNADNSSTTVTTSKNQQDLPAPTRSTSTVSTSSSSKSQSVISNHPSLNNYSQHERHHTTGSIPQSGPRKPENVRKSSSCALS